MNPGENVVSTTDRLRSDIDRGLTGDKVSASDPAAAPLGTDDEAAGYPPTEEQGAAAWGAERKPLNSDHAPPTKWLRALWFIGLLATAAVLVLYSAGDDQ